MIRRLRGAALVAVAAGGTLALTTGGRPWVRVREAAAPGLPSLPATLSGHELAGPVVALGLASLAAAVALLAVRGLAARLVGGLALLLGAGTVGYAWAGARAGPDGVGSVVERTAWPWVALAGGLLVVVGGSLALVHGARWSGLSRRYDAPAPRAGEVPDGDARSAWDALDRGEDPTRSRTDDSA